MTMRLEDLKGDSCVWCDQEIDLSLPHAQKRIYCSAQCRIRQQHNRVHVARIEAKAKLNRQCARCGAPIALSRKLGSSFCSARCVREDGDEINRVGRLEDKQRLNRSCACCDMPISAARRAGAIYCSKACKRRTISAHRRQRYREQVVGETARQNEPVPCRWCKTMFLPRRTVPVPVLCSLACNMAERRARTAPLPVLSCVICSAEYRPTAGCAPRRTCSKPCSLQLRRMTFRAKRSAFQCEAIS